MTCTLSKDLSLECFHSPLQKGLTQSTDCRSARAKEVSDDCRFEFAYNAALQAATTALAAHSLRHWTLSSNCFCIHIIAYRVRGMLAEDFRTD